MKCFHQSICMLCLILNFEILNCARSIFRPIDPKIPTIKTKWKNENKTYYLRNSHLEEQAILNRFDKKHFLKNLIPNKSIKYRLENSKSVTGKKLKELAEELLSDLKNRKTSFKDFTILKKKDFNWKNVYGNIVLKYKNYPFVLKLFIETPESFTKPFSKGWQPACFFLMSGGISRYLSGFTRIKNLEITKNQIKNDPYWSKRIDFPRKWYWMPKNTKWFEVTTINIGLSQEKTIKLPSVYAVIADAIEKDEKTNLLKQEGLQFALNLSYKLNNRLDAHIDNFVPEKKTGKIVIVDTEHFPTMVGLKKHTYFASYNDWYRKLAFKCFQDMFGRHKKLRRELQNHPNPSLSI